MSKKKRLPFCEPLPNKFEGAWLKVRRFASSKFYNCYGAFVPEKNHSINPFRKIFVQARNENFEMKYVYPKVFMSPVHLRFLVLEKKESKSRSTLLSLGTASVVTTLSASQTASPPPLRQLPGGDNSPGSSLSCPLPYYLLSSRYIWTGNFKIFLHIVVIRPKPVISRFQSGKHTKKTGELWAEQSFEDLKWQNLGKYSTALCSWCAKCVAFGVPALCHIADHKSLSDLQKSCQALPCCQNSGHAVD